MTRSYRSTHEATDQQFINLLSNTLEDGSWRLSKWSRWTGRDENGNSVFEKTYEIELYQIGKYRLTETMGEKLASFWSIDQYGDFKGWRTSRGLARKLDLMDEISKVVEARETEKARQESNRQAIAAAVEAFQRRIEQMVKDEELDGMSLEQALQAAEWEIERRAMQRRAERA